MAKPYTYTTPEGPRRIGAAQREWLFWLRECKSSAGFETRARDIRILDRLVGLGLAGYVRTTSFGKRIYQITSSGRAVVRLTRTEAMRRTREALE